MTGKIILDLCGGSGAWSRPYVDAGYDVIKLTLPENDVRFHKKMGNIHGILAAPLCTCFSNANPFYKRGGFEMYNALSIVDACIRIVFAERPTWWALENPPGKLQSYLGKPHISVKAWEFGGNISKTLCLWGEFQSPLKSVFKKPDCKRLDTLGRCGEDARSVTPEHFAQAFMEANP